MNDEKQPPTGVMPERMDIEHPRSQPNSWADYGMGWNAAIDECQAAFAALQEEILQLKSILEKSGISY